jgi:peptidoglycan/LPS O-acetylase OafA/YrhL
VLRAPSHFLMNRGASILDSGAPSGERYRPDIDGLRAVAVLSVVLFHAGFDRFSGGFVGVDIFFVISGFLITRIIRDGVSHGTFSFAKFYVRRMRRLFPALFATVALSFAAGAVLFAPDLFKSFGASSVAALLSFANVYFWLDSGYFDAANSLKPLVHTWSLSVEEQFYLVWPAIMVIAYRWRAAWHVLAALLLASIIGGIALRDEPSAVFYLMPFRVYELAIGGLMVFVVDRVVVPSAARELALLVAFALMGFAILTFNDQTPFPVTGLVPCLGAAIVILCGDARILGFVLRNRLSVGIGLISYSIYLVHWPLVAFYRYAVHDVLYRFDRIAMVVLALIGGFAMNRLVENRYRYARPTSWRPSRFALACGALAGVVVILGLNVQGTGWTWRLGDREAAYLNIRDLYGGAECLETGGIGLDAISLPRCETGAGEPLIVIGDSHALAYFSGMAAHLPDRRLIFFESSACPFFSPDKTRTWSAEQAAYDEPCRDTRQMAFDEIRNTGADVVVAQNWYRLTMISETTDERWEFTTNDQWAEFAGHELGELKRALGIENLVVIGNVPTLGDDLVSPVDCMARPIRLTDGGCSTTALDSITLAGRKDFNATLGASVASFASFADPYDYLCDEVECANFLNGRPLYTNRTHLSELGSSLVVEGMLSSTESPALAP